MKIRILSKVAFLAHVNRLGITKENIDTSPYRFICVNGTTQDSYNLPLFPNTAKNVLNLYFDDVEKDLEIVLLSDPPSKKHLCKAFTPDQAIVTIDFLEQIDKNEVEELVIHCHAGVSRSGAIGTFAREYLDLDLKEFRNLNPNIYPNAKVLRELNNIIWRRKGIYGEA